VTWKWWSSAPTEKGNMDAKMSALAAYRAGKLRLPPSYHIGCDAEVLTLYRHDGSMVAAFGARVAPSLVARTAEDDYRANRKRSA
jgi:hypothetical protein